MDIANRIATLRKLMQERGIDLYIVPTSDYHQSEYVGDYFKCREFMTGFTGSAGMAVFTKEEAGLWTDGRYFIQAEQELAGTEVTLYKMGEPDVPTIEEYIGDKLPENGVIGFDGRTIELKTGQKYEKIAEEKHGTIFYTEDLINLIWENRPSLSEKPAFLLDEKYAGESVSSKLARIREKMREREADQLLMTTLDDIDWMLNIRGNDVEYFPLLLSYAIIYEDKVELYADRRKFDSKIQKHFEENHVIVLPYDDIYEVVKRFTEKDTIYLDPKRINYALYKNLPAQTEKVCGECPTVLMKCVKNETEVQNIREAHLKDGIAHTRFMYWLKSNIGKMEITEMSASAKLEEFRAQQPDYLGASFDPICAYKEHGAIVHYTSTPETNVPLKPEGLFLTDTGGHYFQGSTDITRTVALGPISDTEKQHFTTVAISMLTLANARFLYGCTGLNLDYAAREPFWRMGLNFNHGTGHGVGYLGNIHEPPIGFRWRFNPEDSQTLEANMVITDEPGIYIEGSHGIRTENELLVCKGEKNEYGQFMYFEPLTLVPIDLDAIDPAQMNVQERELLNAYHRRVRDTIGPHLPEKEREWLEDYTREI